MLTQPEVAAYLLQHEYLSPETIVSGDLAILDASRRNRNFKITTNNGPCYLVKQGQGPENEANVEHEARVYAAFQAAPRSQQRGRYVPRFHAYDRDARLLILELVPHAQDLREYHGARGRFPVTVARSLGEALSALHRDITPGEAGAIRGAPPWILSFHCPRPDVLRTISSANLQIVQIIQGTPGFGKRLDDLREGWQTGSFIHFDVKWENCLVSLTQASTRGPVVKLVDWEFAALGDPCWDVGSVFSSYLSAWLFSIPVIGEEAPDRFLELARCPLSRMQPAMRACWAAYIRGMALDATTADAWLIRSVRYAGTRLVQTGYEHMQAAAHLTGNLVCLLQLGFNILQRPQEAAVQLLGISSGGRVRP